jgi:hypothetical protein
MTVPIVLFALAASGGAFLAHLRLREKQLPMPVALLHGLLGLCGILALASMGLGNTTPWFARIAFAVFIAAMFGGLFLFSFHLRRMPLPKPLMFMHAGAAVVAFVLLLIAAL